MKPPLPDRRPVVVAIAGPNGAGKTTFYNAFLRASGLRLVSADVLAQELDLDAYDAARIAAELRRSLVASGESFAFETVFSDPAGEKLAFLEDALARGYSVVLCFIGVSGPEVCEERVAMRVSKGGHDVPSEKIASRYPRTLANLAAAIRVLPLVLVFDNDDLRHPMRRAAVVEDGKASFRAEPLPEWLRAVLG